MLLTVSELTIWCRPLGVDVDPADPFVPELIAAASDKVRTAAGVGDLWPDVASAPSRARQIASHLAARSYANPESITTDGSLGPLGGDRRAEDLSRALHLTASEEAELISLGKAVLGTGNGGLWIQPVGIDNTVQSLDAYLYAGDSDWGIPYLSDDEYLALG